MTHTVKACNTICTVYYFKHTLSVFFGELTLSRATEQYCAAGAILKPLCLPKQLTLCSQQHIDRLFPGHILCQLFANYIVLQRTTVFFLQNMCTVIIGFARERVKVCLRIWLKVPFCPCSTASCACLRVIEID